jgi:hypothetical protein
MSVFGICGVVEKCFPVCLHAFVERSNVRRLIVELRVVARKRLRGSVVPAVDAGVA